MIIKSKTSKKGNRVTLSYFGGNKSPYILTVESPMRFCCFSFKEEKEALNSFDSKLKD